MTRQSLKHGLLLTTGVLCTLLSIYHVFNLGRFTGFTMFNVQFVYLFMALSVPAVFLLKPGRLTRRDGHIPLYDLVLAAATLISLGYFTLTAKAALFGGWEFDAPQVAVWFSFALWALILEATRRVAGWPVFAVVLVMSLFPVFAGYLPDSVAAASTPIDLVAIYHAISGESMMGAPSQAFGQIVVGFLILGAALQYTGGGKFFINLSLAMMGRYRGGPGKVAVVSSGLMGSLSGTVVSNVLTTGPMTIPAMQKVGFSRSVSGAVEACASTGAVLMPPVMGAVAFIMAVFAGVSYAEIVAAATIPSLLYYLALLLQVDFLAARSGIRGMARAELPHVWNILKTGWHYILVLLMLVYMLSYLQREAMAPFYATALLLVLNQIRAADRWGWSQLGAFLRNLAVQMAELMALMAGIGMVIGGLTVTGMSGTIANDLLFIAGGNHLVLLIMGAVTSFILGFGMSITAAYIFLAVSLVPALVGSGLDPLAVHLFILYWGMMSYITPPVAMGAFTAAAIAGASPMQTGFSAMKMGAVLYFIPFFFVLQPALILRGEPALIVQTIGLVLAGFTLMICALQAYVPWFGRLSRLGRKGWLARGALFIGGLAIPTPPHPLLGLADGVQAGIAVAAVGLAAAMILLAPVVGRARQTGNAE